MITHKHTAIQDANKQRKNCYLAPNQAFVNLRKNRATGWGLWFSLCRTPCFWILIHTLLLFVKGLLLQDILFSMFHQPVHANPFIPAVGARYPSFSDHIFTSIENSKYSALLALLWSQISQWIICQYWTILYTDPLTIVNFVDAVNIPLRGNNLVLLLARIFRFQRRC